MWFKYTCVEDRFLPKGIGYLPLVDVNIGERKIPLRCLVDSGSPVTIIHSPIAVATGIVPVDGKKSSLFGIGSGKLDGYYQTITMNLYGNQFSGAVFITADLGTPYGLLGQIGFFEHFRVDFKMSQRSFKITPN